MWCLETPFGVNGWTQGTCRFFPNLNNSMILWITRSVSHLHKENHYTEDNSVQQLKAFTWEATLQRGEEQKNPWKSESLAFQPKLICSSAELQQGQIKYLWAVRSLETEVGTKHPEGSSRDILPRSLEMTIPSPWKRCQDGFSTSCQVLVPNPAEMEFMEPQNGWD